MRDIADPSSARSRRHVHLAVLVLLACASWWSPRGLAAGVEKEAEAAAVKAAFLYRFRGYVQWPGTRPQEFTVAVLDDDALVAHLREFLADRPAELRGVRVQSVQSAVDARDAQVLFVGASESARLREHVAAVGERPVLVVSDEAGTLSAGQTINFVTIDRRVRFEVSLGAAQRAGLRIHAGLLNVAARVEGVGPDTNVACARTPCAQPSLLARDPLASEDDPP